MGDLMLAHTPALGRRGKVTAATASAWHDLLAPLTAFATVAALGAADGGYFPRQWGWSSLALLWIAALALLVRSSVRLGVLELGMLAGLSGLVGWIATSIAWSEGVSAPVLEVQRALLYLACLLAIFLLARGRTVTQLLGAVLAGVTVVSTYSLATRLFPERLGVFDPLAGYRLSTPLGYWNALGIFAVLGALLALGVAARGRRPAARGLAAASLVVLLPTVYFTFGRGPWIALALGLTALIALDPRRLQLVTTMLVVTPAPAAAVWLASRSDALTRQQAVLADASRDGHRLAVTILVLAAIGAAVTAGLAAAEGRVTIHRRLRLAYGSALLLVLAAALSVVFARYGSPPTLVSKGYDAFRAPPPAVEGDLGQRLFTFSGSGRALYWSVAWEDAKEHPRLGSGAGSYEQRWVQHRPVPSDARDAHNLYLETLAELGPVGLGLLLGTLALPLVAAFKARSRRLVPAAFGAYVAYLVHAGADWDWEMPAVTVAALLCGAGLLVAARNRQGAKGLSNPVRIAALAAALVLGAFAFVGFIGSSALHVASEAVLAERWSDAQSEARKAIRWAPWSSEARQQLGLAQLEQGDRALARSSFLEALEREPGNWLLWLDLANATAGAEQLRALGEAERLNPFNRSIAELRELLRAQEEDGA